MKPTVINLTPHHIHVVGDSNETIATFPPEGTVARVEVESYRTALEDTIGVPTTASVLGKITGLPEPQEGLWFITSQIVATAAMATRSDVLHPGGLVRDAYGNPIGCKSLNSPM